MHILKPYFKHNLGSNNVSIFYKNIYIYIYDIKGICTFKPSREPTYFIAFLKIHFGPGVCIYKQWN